MLDELKQKAAPKCSELLELNKELLAEKKISNDLLRDLCQLKTEQQQGDIKFRNKWRSAKANDTRVSIVLLVLANIALYLDVIRVDREFISGLIALLN